MQQLLHILTNAALAPPHIENKQGNTSSTMVKTSREKGAKSKKEEERESQHLRCPNLLPRVALSVITSL
jgi:hypothetical protein